MSSCANLISQVYLKYSKNEGGGYIKSSVLRKLYNELYELLNVHDKEENLNLINEFISLNPDLILVEPDINYLHEKLTGKFLEDLDINEEIVVANDRSQDEARMKEDEVRLKEVEEVKQLQQRKREDMDTEKVTDEEVTDEDACQILYSPHKKGSKIVPDFQDADELKDKIARNLFKSSSDADLDLTLDIFKGNLLLLLLLLLPKLANKNESSLKPRDSITHELNAKKTRIQDLENVLMELQNYISNLKKFNNKEVDKLRERYETKITHCELQIEEIGNSIRYLESNLLRQNKDSHKESNNNKSIRPTEESGNLHSFKLFGLVLKLRIIVVIAVVCVVFSSILLKSVFFGEQKMFSRVKYIFGSKKEETWDPQSLEDFVHLLELMKRETVEL